MINDTPDYLANLLTPNTTIYEQRHINKFKLKTPVLSHLTSAQHKSFSILSPFESTSENFNKEVDGSS